MNTNINNNNNPNCNSNNNNDENANSDKSNKELKEDEMQPCIAVHCIAGLGRYLLLLILIRFVQFFSKFAFA